MLVLAVTACMQAINRLAWGAEPTVTLTQYIIVFGAFNLIIAQARTNSQP